MQIKHLLLTLIHILLLMLIPGTSALGQSSQRNNANIEERHIPNSAKEDKFKEVTGKVLLQKGLFSIYLKENDYYFAIPHTVLGRDLLVVNKLTKVPSELNEAGVNRGINYQNQMVRWEWDKANNKLLLRQQRPLPYSPQNNAITSSVKNNFISPLIAAFSIESVASDSSSILIKVNDIYNGTENSINNVFGNINLGTSPISNLSRILSIKAFTNNIVASSELTTKVSEGTSSVYITVEVSSSMMLLPEIPMQGRHAHPKVGYFTTPFLHFSDSQQSTTSKHYITRWRMEPKENDIEAYLKGSLVEPLKPIVFYIDSATPHQWRPYIKKGVEDWQTAFEKAGFKNAIIAKEMNDSLYIDEDDVNYSVITYAASQKKNAMGPSLLDPRSGEILEADIMWWHNVIDMLSEWITIQTGAVNADARSIHLPDTLLGDAIRFVASHEVGHSLGLRHNMIASWAFPTDSLRSASFTSREKSTAASIMDYARFNYVAQPNDKVQIYAPQIGPYDLFAIEYGYRWYGTHSSTEEVDILKRFIQQHNQPQYKYSEAQDMRDAIDPRAQSEDLGNDPIYSSSLGIANLKRIVPQILSWTTNNNSEETYTATSKLYYAAIHQWNTYLYHVLANIGGIYLENTTIGDGLQAFTFVEKETQEKAIQFIISEALQYPSWLFDTEIEKYTYLLKDTPNGVQENSPTLVLTNIQAYLLWDLLSNNRLMRMLENEAKNGEKAFTAIQLMEHLHNYIFATTEHGKNPNLYERRLQKNFIDVLLTASAEAESIKTNKKLFTAEKQLFNHPISLCNHLTEHQIGAPRSINFYGSQPNRISDAISIKRGELLRVKKLLSKRIRSSDTATKYHYEDIILRINTALGIK